MSESGDYTPGPWSDSSSSSSSYNYSNFKDATSVYDNKRKDDAIAPKKSTSLSALAPPFIETKSESPVPIIIDCTGSMGVWTSKIFGKLPFLDRGSEFYLGPTVEFAFTACGDANSDKQPVQIQKFGRGLELADNLKNLYIEGNGGGQMHETYELHALYMARNCKIPNATTPICIFIADEAPYTSVNRDQAAEYAKVDLPRNLPTSDVFRELKEKFSVYVILKRYDGSEREIRAIYDAWESLVGADHIAHLDDPNRVVDVIFGIFAKETGKIKDFVKEIEGRQTSAQVKTVYTALRTIHGTGATNPTATPKGASKLLPPKPSKP